MFDAQLELVAREEYLPRIFDLTLSWWCWSMTSGLTGAAQ
jgi:hypothetical protein